MKTKQILVNTLLVIVISGMAIMTYHHFFKPKYAYVEIKKIFNGFQMKKELEEKFKQTQKTREKVLDSLSFDLTLVSKHLKESKNVDQETMYQFEYKRNEYLKMKKQFDEDNAALSQKYDNQILEQITQYVLDYGKKHNYGFIFGADGNGNLMYANDGNNITTEVTQYVNNRYKGIE